MRLIKTLLQHPVSTLTYKEARYLHKQLINYYNYYDSGLNGRVLARQMGVSPQEFNYVMTNREHLLQALEQQGKALDKRVSQVFSDSYVRETLDALSFDILDYIEEGYKPAEIYELVGILPSRHQWHNFLTRLRKRGHDIKEIKKYRDQRELEYA